MEFVEIPVYTQIKIKEKEDISENKEYFDVKNEYISLVNIYREKEEDQFIGGMPVQLEKGCLKQLLRMENGKLVYILTLKADGERYLMFLSKSGVLYFINRSTSIFYFKNNEIPIGYQPTELVFLFDGELIKHPNGTYEFLIFDVIFYQESGKVYSWMNHSYTDRHFIMNRAINTDLYNFPGLYFSLKPWYPINLIAKTDNIYDYIVKDTNKQRKAAGKYPIVDDGLILQPLDTEYVPFREWNKWNNVQFKWKPPNQLTIDFKIKVINKNLWHLLTKTDQNYNINQLKGKPVPAICEPTDKMNELYHDGDVVEFKYYRGNNPQSNKFVPVRSRNEKSANSYKTIMSTLHVIKNPFTLDILQPAIKELSTGDKNIKDVLMTLSKSDLVLIAMKDRLFFSEREVQQIKNVYEEFRQNDELEFRVFQRGKKGNVIDRFTYFYFLDFLTRNFKGDYIYTVDLVKNVTNPQDKKYRSTYGSIEDIYRGKIISNQYKQDISSFILFPTDKGQQLYNNLVLKLNLSKEIPTEIVTGLKNEKTKNLIRSKKRISFKINELWRIDITRILSSYNISELVEKNETYELECEYIGTKIPFEDFVKSMNVLYKFILNNTSYC